jgi:hypothetical protein
MKLYAVQFKDSLKVEWITDDPNMGDVFGATILHSIDIVAPKKTVKKTLWHNVYKFYDEHDYATSIPYLTEAGAREEREPDEPIKQGNTYYIGTFHFEIEVEE